MFVSFVNLLALSVNDSVLVVILFVFVYVYTFNNKNDSFVYFVEEDLRFIFSICVYVFLLLPVLQCNGVKYATFKVFCLFFPRL